MKTFITIPKQGPPTIGANEYDLFRDALHGEGRFYSQTSKDNMRRVADWAQDAADFGDSFKPKPIGHLISGGPWG